MAIAKPKANSLAVGTFESFLVDHGFLNKTQQDRLLAGKSAKYGTAETQLEPTALAQLLRQYNIVSLLTKEKKCLRNCSTTF